MPAFDSRSAGFRYAAVAGLALALTGFAGGERVLIFLPGTQPGTVNDADNVVLCRSCHSSDEPSRPVAIGSEWSGSMMAQSARDPIFYAALAVANKYDFAAGEFCIRCHSPTGWLAGRSKSPTGQTLTGSDFDGVQCDYCHRSVDPMAPDSSAPGSIYPVPGYGNGMHTFQRFATPKRGPYDSVSSAHATMADEFQRSSALCGVCHDVSNPFQTGGQDRIFVPPSEYAPLERTYSEWLLSDFSKDGENGSCQSCHMKPTPGYGSVVASSPMRMDLARHDLTGGNSFVPGIIRDFWPGLDSAALAGGSLRAVATLRNAAELALVARRIDTAVVATVRVTNLTGHKLPTGYPDGRRMWIRLTGRDAQGDTIFESGKYDADSALLVLDDRIRIYQALYGMRDSTARSYNLEPGFSLHFVLNDTLLLDNRIPPRGFTNAAFAERRAAPVGAAYADSQYWDEAEYILPAKVTEVTAGLYYQTISR